MIVDISQNSTKLCVNKHPSFFVNLISYIFDLELIDLVSQLLMLNVFTFQNTFFGLCV